VRPRSRVHRERKARGGECIERTFCQLSATRVAGGEAGPTGEEAAAGIEPVGDDFARRSCRRHHRLWQLCGGYFTQNHGEQ